MPGVGLVSLAGGQRPAVRIQANPQALAAHNLNLQSLRAVIAAANVNQPKGNFDGPERSFMLDANDQLRSADDYRDLIVAYSDGAPLRLSDVADVVDGAENTRLAAWADDLPAVLVNVQRQPGANVIEVVDRVTALLPQLDGQPARRRSTVAVLSDRTDTIRASVRDVQHELMFAVGLVVLVTFVFLRNIAGDDHPQRRRAAVAGRHVRRDVPRRLLDQQPDADGADHRDRLRRRRRDRDGREHRALPRGGRHADGGRARRRARRSASRWSR